MTHLLPFLPISKRLKKKLSKERDVLPSNRNTAVSPLTLVINKRIFLLLAKAVGYRFRYIRLILSWKGVENKKE